MKFKINTDIYLVRFGGAGAVLPFLFVVRLICTLTLLPPVENVDNFDDDVPGSVYIFFSFHNNQYIHYPDRSKWENFSG